MDMVELIKHGDESYPMTTDVLSRDSTHLGLAYVTNCSVRIFSMKILEADFRYRLAVTF